MLSEDDLTSLVAYDVYSSDGEKLGKAERIYIEELDGTPEWLVVAGGLLGLAESYVPLSGAELTDGKLVVAFAKDVVKQAPAVSDGGQLSAEDEERLYDYYQDVAGITPP